MNLILKIAGVPSLMMSKVGSLQRQNQEINIESISNQINWNTVKKLGHKRTKWLNFKNVCSTLNRDPVHIQRFYETQMATSTTIDESLPIYIARQPKDSMLCELLINGYSKLHIMIPCELNRIIFNFYYCMDGEAFILKGRWKPKQLQNILKKYISEYVTCNNCLSTNTKLIQLTPKRKGEIIICTDCKYQRVTKRIKSGFGSYLAGPSVFCLTFI